MADSDSYHTATDDEKGAPAAWAHASPATAFAFVSEENALPDANYDLEAGVPVPVLAASDAGTLHPGIAHAGSLKSASEWRLRCIFSLVFRCSEARGG